MHPLLHRIWWRISRVLVYALVGPSGSGKSHRARLVASRYNIPLIVDDGLLIEDEKIIAGKSAKKEENYLKAIKTALFEEQDHRNQVVQALEKISFKKILLLGTSLKMVRRMAYRLDLPKIYKVITIEEIATPEEIESAMINRREGRHVIPAPIREVSRHHGPHFLEPVQVMIEGRMIRFFPPKTFHKTVVLPGFHKSGPDRDLEGLKELIRSWLRDFDPEMALSRLEIRKERQSLKIGLYFTGNDGLEWTEKAGKLRDFLQDHLAHYSGWKAGRSEVRIFGGSPDRKGREDQE